MKKITLLLVLTILAFSFNNVQAAGNTGQTTTAGAVSGALVGQAIGRNTEGTLIGATLGGVIGYIVGNEMDKGGDVRRYSHHAPVIKHVYVTPPRRPEVRVIIQHEFDGYRNGPRHWRRPGHRDRNWNRHHKYYKRHRYGKGQRGHRGSHNVVIW